MIVKKSGSLQLLDLNINKIIIKCNIMNLIASSLPVSSSKEYLEKILLGETLGFTLTDNDKLIIKMPTVSFMYDSNFKEWAQVDNMTKMDLNLLTTMEKLQLNNISNLEFLDQFEDISTSEANESLISKNA